MFTTRRRAPAAPYLKFIILTGNYWALVHNKICLRLGSDRLQHRRR